MITKGGKLSGKAKASLTVIVLMIMAWQTTHKYNQT